MYVLSPTFFKNSNTMDNRLQHNFQSYAWELHAPTLIFFHGLLILYTYWSYYVCIVGLGDSGTITITIFCLKNITIVNISR